MIRSSGAIGASPRRISPPKGFDWNFAAHPVDIFDTARRSFGSDIDPKSKVSPGIWSGPRYWVAHDGSDDNAGTSRKAPLASAWKARQLAESAPEAANGYSINVVPDPLTGLIFLDGTRNFDHTADLDGTVGSQVAGSRPFALVCHGGRLIMGPCRLGTYSAADTATNSWVNEVAQPGIGAVYNPSELGAFGVPARISKITAGVIDDASALAAVQAAPDDAWAQAAGSGNFYVRLADGRPVSNATVRVALPSYGLRLGTGDAYISGVELVGGSIGAGAVDAGSVARRTLVFEDVGACGSGVTGGPAGPAFGIDNMTGLAILRRCYGYNALGSIFSFRNTAGQLHALMIDCWGLDAGLPGADPVGYQNQIVAVQDGVRLISLNTQAGYSAGGCVRTSGDAQHWDLGSTYAYDRGDYWLGPDGAVPSTGVRVEDRARYWGQDVTVAGCETSIFAGSSAQVRMRSPIEIGGRRDGPGSVEVY